MGGTSSRSALLATAIAHVGDASLLMQSTVTADDSENYTILFHTLICSQNVVSDPFVMEPPTRRSPIVNIDDGPLPMLAITRGRRRRLRRRMNPRGVQRQP